eukprot:CAMPEP_0172386448 /NCGR_PEP_ID=MMETSP1061-20121228/3995_1 /TAXON_ID=37318 /ORGANISM="Pseudo-nitzschia pungens, Strain cf. pungens" /LENGTH=631 /DNA_ID=CAMNT_0013115833 /DNA_START=338 /DNA_END=2233 /DNA_ORIENTATION=+
MESPNISIRIRRHESLPCHSNTSTNSINGKHGISTSARLRRHRTIHSHSTASVLIGRRLGATKNNPYIGSFRHAPPTSLRSMEASSLPSLFSRTESASSPSVLLSPPYSGMSAVSSAVPAMKNSPYVGWFRHAPPSFSSYYHVISSNKNKDGGNRRAGTRTMRKSLFQHRINPDSPQELGRWHQQLSSLLLGVEKSLPSETSEKTPPLLLRRIINGRLLGGNGRQDTNRSNSSSNNYDDNRIMMSPGYNAIFSRLTSWLLFPLIYADYECYDDYVFNNDDIYYRKRNTNGLKFLVSSMDDRSIQIDSDEDGDSDDDDDCSSADSCDYNPTSETEREFAEMNVSVSEIAEAYYAHQLLDERRRRSNSDATTSSEGRGLDPSSYHDGSDDSGEEIQQRLDYEITQMDIARMTRNASRHLDVDSILTLPTITYRKKQFSPPIKACNYNKKMQQFEKVGDRSYHHVCTPIYEEGGHMSGSSKSGTRSLEDGWSFLMVSGEKSNSNVNHPSNVLYPIADKEETESTGSNDDVCVICLEAFKEGERLRVLPCNHSFHVGCIDRWLSGSHSHNECYTAGCPTCKKRPSLSSSSSSLRRSITEDREDDMEDTMSGSVPSWAFANLGSAMAMSLGHHPDI